MKTKRSPSGTPGATGGPVTADQADDREAGHVVAKSLRCKPWEVTGFAPSSRTCGQMTARCWIAG